MNPEQAIPQDGMPSDDFNDSLMYIAVCDYTCYIFRGGINERMKYPRLIWRKKCLSRHIYLVRVFNTWICLICSISLKPCVSRRIYGQTAELRRL
jgi:hypothetical protein